jgi:hypothetical protein
LYDFAGWETRSKFNRSLAFSLDERSDLTDSVDCDPDAFQKRRRDRWMDDATAKKKKNAFWGNVRIFKNQSFIVSMNTDQSPNTAEYIKFLFLNVHRGLRWYRELSNDA